MENSLILEYGKLIWTVKRGTLWNQANNAINLCRFIHPLIYAAINCTVYHVPCCHGEQAGIYCFYDQDHYIKWVQERLDGQIWLVVAKEYKGDGELICRFPWEEGKVCLRCELGNGKVRFLARHQGDQGYWVEFQECDLSCFSFFKKGPEFLLAAHGHQQDDRVVRATLDNIQFVGILK